MRTSERQRAIAAAVASATAQGLTATDATVLNDSNRLVLRLMPCDVVARVARVSHHTGSTEVEIDVVRRLAGADAPVAVLAPGVEPRIDIRDGFVVTMWKHYDSVPSRDLAPAEYVRALQRLHAGLRRIDAEAPHFMDRVRETQEFAASHDVTPDLADADRALLSNTLTDLGNAIVARGAAEQLLHGEPHPWNVLDTAEGLLFIDFENVARGPVEYDLAWVPDDGSARYPDVDHELIAECRGVVIAIIAAHRWRRDDQHPSGPQRATWISAVRQGPPWPALDDV